MSELDCTYRLELEVVGENLQPPTSYPAPTYAQHIDCYLAEALCDNRVSGLLSNKEGLLNDDGLTQHYETRQARSRQIHSLCSEFTLMY